MSRTHQLYSDDRNTAIASKIGVSGPDKMRLHSREVGDHKVASVRRLASQHQDS